MRFLDTDTKFMKIRFLSNNNTRFNTNYLTFTR
jgi:hypothetical protein